jgi:hypothetical protein
MLLDIPEDFLIVQSFRTNLNLEAVTLFKYHKLKARGYPFFVTHASILTWGHLVSKSFNHP